jgi:cyclohexanone monooxygenase
MANRWNLYDDAIFQTQATEVTWDESLLKWVVKTDRDDTFTAQFLMTAGGPLHRPKLPDIEGIESFKGVEFRA